MVDVIELAKFIQKLRKEKGLTQKDIANSLNVTVQAVSKWETGKCYPDMYLFKPLSELLGITVVELMNAKRIEPNNMEDETMNTIVNTVKKSHKKIKKIILMSLIIIYIVLLITLLILSYRGNANKLGELINIYYSDKNFEIKDIYLAISNDYKTQDYVGGKFIILNNDLKKELIRLDIDFCYERNECYNIYSGIDLQLYPCIYNLSIKNVYGIFDDKGKSYKNRKHFENKVYSSNIVVKLYYDDYIKEFELKLKYRLVVYEHSSAFKLKY